MADRVTSLVIIGAGAAGLAAADRASALAIDVVLVEASDRIGGRAQTVNHESGQQWDLGAHWLHQAPVNPLAPIADEQRAIPVRPWQPVSGIWIGGTWLSDFERTEIANVIDESEELARDLAATGEDAAFAELIDPAFTLRSPVDDLLLHRFGVRPQMVSAVDVSRFGRQDGSWPVGAGLGAVLTARFAGVPVTRNAPVHVVDWSGDQIRIDLGRDLIVCDFAIVTVSTGVLATSDIVFAPALPDETLQAIAGLPMATMERIAFTWPDWPGGFPDETLIHTLAAGLSILFETPAAGSNLLVATIADSTRLADGQLHDVIASRCTEVFGAPGETIADVRTSDWSTDPYVRGSTAWCLPGFPSARALLATPVDHRLYFAGEATSATAWGMVHGAMQSGIDAVNAIAITLGLIPEMPKRRDTTNVFRYDF